MTISFRVDSDEECAFRIEVREWLEANLPDDLRGAAAMSIEATLDFLAS